MLLYGSKIEKPFWSCALLSEHLRFFSYIILDEELFEKFFFLVVYLSGFRRLSVLYFIIC